MSHPKGPTINADAATPDGAARWRSLLTEAVLGVDRANAACPVKGRGYTEDRCSKCGASRQQNCGPELFALGTLEKTVRGLLLTADGAKATGEA